MATAKRRGIRAAIIAISIVVLAVVLSFVLGELVATNLGAQLNPERIRRDEAMAWFARALLALALLWIVIGIIATRTSLVRRPGAAAARATWLASTRPWRTRESMLGLLPLDRTLLVVVPAGLFVCSGIVLTSFMTPAPTLLLLLAYGLFAMTMVLVMRPWSGWPAITTIGGIIMCLCVVVLAGASVSGPLAFWIAIWTNVAVRIVVVTLVLGLIAWMVVAVGGAINAQVGTSAATANTLIATGVAVAVPATIAALIGVDRVDRSWQDPIVRVLIPDAYVWVLAGIGFAAALVGMFLRARKTRR